MQALHEDIARLTRQLSKVTYALYRVKQDSSSGTSSSLTSTLSLAVATFAVSAFVPPEAIVVKLVSLLAGE